MRQGISVCAKSRDNAAAFEKRMQLLASTQPGRYNNRRKRDYAAYLFPLDDGKQEGAFSYPKDCKQVSVKLHPAGYSHSLAHTLFQQVRTHC